MAKTAKYVFSTSASYDSHFASTLRGLMEKNGTTQKQLAAFIGIRPQSLAQYCTGETQPNGDKLLKIAEYYHVTVDYLLTGTVIENIPVYEMLGLSERTVENIKLIKDGYFEDTPGMLTMLDALLGDKDFYLAFEKCTQEYGIARQYDYVDNPSMKELHEWKAKRYLEQYLLDFLSMRYQVSPETEKDGD